MKTSKGGHLKGSKGFTLIELLVVIAIIGLLASVVLASIGSARQKGGDAAVQSNLDGIRSQAEIVASENTNSYATVCTNQTVLNAITAAKTAANVTAAIGGNTADANSTTAVCHSVATGWAVSVPLLTNSANFWCVDGKGNTGITTTLTADSVTCGS